MTPAVEAKSLSAVIELAADPPGNYEFGVHESQEPLVLYIARIPGSKDFFLSTVKPLHKVVTASDVQSCLYYVHVDNIEDEKLRKSLEVEKYQSEEDGYHGRAQNEDRFWREPAVPEASSTYQDHPELPPRITPYLQPPKHTLKSSIPPERKPVGSNTGFNPKSMHFDSRHSAQNLVGPRPMHQRLHSVDDTASSMNFEQKDSNLRRWSEQLRAGPKRGFDDCLADGSFGGSSKQQGANGGDTTHEYRRNSQSTVRSAETDYDQASLTLIRRYDGMQWNVANISTTSCIASSDDTHQNQKGVSITISTPGYAKFMDQDGKTDSYERAPRFFGRQLWKASDRKRPELQKKSGSHSSSLSMHGLKTKLKIGKVAKQDTSDGNAGETAMPSKGYVFYSPWGGICELNTSIAGQSLKCKHIMNSSRSISKANVTPISVSELRFNLPGSKSPRDSSHDYQSINGNSKEPKRSSFLSTKHQRSPSSFEVRGDQNHEGMVFHDEKMDLSLGQEHAGGGFGGKQAKLGKLIIEKEGMKMLDLVVAANIGLWWRAYSKM